MKFHFTSSTVCYSSLTETGGFVHSSFYYTSSSAGNPNSYLYLHSFVHGTLIYSNFWHRGWFFHIWRLNISSPLFFSQPCEQNMMSEWARRVVFMWSKDDSPIISLSACKCWAEGVMGHYKERKKPSHASWWLEVEGQCSALHGAGGHFPHVSNCPQILQEKAAVNPAPFTKADSWNCDFITGYWDF